MQETDYKYDAFISYRHGDLNYAVAHRLQRLLEGFAAPWRTPCAHTTRIKRVFVDDTEMPNSSDLTRNIHDALDQSRYLIVLCCDELLESTWCHDEVCYFKKINGQSAKHIIPVLVSGDPKRKDGEASKVFFPEMLETTEAHLNEQGEEEIVTRPIEPLYTDIRAKTMKETLRNLSKQRLRVAAPLLGCGYDALYRRHRRRIIRRVSATAMATVIVGSAVGIALSNMDASRREASAELKYNNASQALQTGDPALGMLFFTDALALSPKQNIPGRIGLSLLMQRYAWALPLPAQEGTILGDTLLLSVQSAKEAPAHSLRYENMSSTDILAIDTGANMLLLLKDGCYQVCALNGTVLDTIDASTLVYAGLPESCGGFVFASMEEERMTFMVYETVAEELRTLATETLTFIELGGLLPETMLALSYEGGRAAVVCHADQLAFYRLEENTFVLTDKIHISNLFKSSSPFSNDSFLSIHSVQIDPAGQLLAVTDGRRITVLSLQTKKVVFRDEQTEYYVSDISFSHEKPIPHHIAASYGMAPSSSIETGGGMQVFSLLHSETLLDTRGSAGTAVKSIHFAPGGGGWLVSVSYDQRATIYEPTENGLEALTGSVSADGSVTGAMAGGLGLFTLASNGRVRGYGALMSRSDQVTDLNDDRYQIRGIIPEGDTIHLVTINNLVTVNAATGEQLSNEGRGPAFDAFIAAHRTDFAEEMLLLQETNTELIPAWMEKAAFSHISGNLQETSTGESQPGRIVKDMVLSVKGRLYAIGSAVPFLSEMEADIANEQLTMLAMRSLPFGATPEYLRLSPDGARLAVSLVNGDVLIYRVGDLDKPIAALAAASASSIRKMAFDSSLAYLAVAAYDKKENTGSLMLWHIDSETLLIKETFEGQIVDAVCFDGDVLYYGRESALYQLSLHAPETNDTRLSFFKALSGYETDQFGLLKSISAPEAEELLTVQDDWNGLYSLITELKGVRK